MGMFDYIKYKDDQYQTKDTPVQALDQYEIRDDGTLWYEDYESNWLEDNQSMFGGYIEKKNKKWVLQEKFTGEIRFYRSTKDKKEWIEYSAYFVNGKALHIQEI